MNPYDFDGESYVNWSRIIFYISLVSITGHASSQDFMNFSEEHSLESMTLDVFSFAVTDKAVFMIAANSNRILEREDKKRIAELHKSKYFKSHIVKGLEKDDYFINIVDNGLLLVSAQKLNAYYISKDFEIISSHSIAYDLILPPRDRGGEAPEYEIKHSRREFLKQYLATEGRKLAGVTVRSMQKQDNTNIDLFLLTHLPSFPLLKLNCDRESPSRCMIKRFCHIEDYADIASERKGITTYVKDGHEYLVLGNDNRHEVTFYRFDHCMNSSLKQKVKLSERIKKLSDLRVFENEFLWVSTFLADNYFNANIFWKKISQ